MVFWNRDVTPAPTFSALNYRLYEEDGAMTLLTHHLVFTARATTPLELDAQAGSSLRGALVGALWGRFCANHDAPSCAACPLISACPVAALIAPLRDDPSEGGDQRPRPYVVQPPPGGRLVPGEELAFGLRLFGSAAVLFPYVVMAAHGLEQSGLGRPLRANGGRRGLLQIERIEALHPLSGARQTLAGRGQAQVHSPGLPVSADEVRAHAAALPPDRLTLRLRTPLRLIDDGRLVKRLTLRPLVQRLLRRLDDLCVAYGGGLLELDAPRLLALAEQARVADDQTRWVDLVSSSSRLHTRTPIGGLVGQITFAGDLAELRELLLWGSLVHIGKNAVKGDGWVEVRGNG